MRPSNFSVSRVSSAVTSAGSLMPVFFRASNSLWSVRYLSGSRQREYASSSGLRSGCGSGQPGARDAVTAKARSTSTSRSPDQAGRVGGVTKSYPANYFAQVSASGAEIVQEPTEQPWGTRDFAVRDPSGNMVRIDQPPAQA